MVDDHAGRSSRIPRPRARGRRAGRRSLPRPSLRSPRSAFWAAALREELRCPAVDLELGLEFADPPLGGGQLVALDRRQPGDEPSVNLLLAPPGVDRLIADTEIAGNIGDLAPGLNEIHDATPKLGRITPSSHGCLLIETGA